MLITEIQELQNDLSIGQPNYLESKTLNKPKILLSDNLLILEYEYYESKIVLNELERLPFCRDNICKYVLPTGNIIGNRSHFSKTSECSKIEMDIDQEFSFYCDNFVEYCNFYQEKCEAHDIHNLEDDQENFIIADYYFWLYNTDTRTLLNRKLLKNTNYLVLSNVQLNFTFLTNEICINPYTFVNEPTMYTIQLEFSIHHHYYDWVMKISLGVATSLLSISIIMGVNWSGKKIYNKYVKRKPISLEKVPEKKIIKIGKTKIAYTAANKDDISPTEVPG